MHMANELLSVPVALGTLACAAGGLGYICRKVKATITNERWALMGVMGAFVFAAQMINIQLPVMPGTSGHMIGAVLLAVVLGPHAAGLVMSSVIIVQCLIFQDGGLLALGCNLINMALIPSYLGFGVYSLATQGKTSGWRLGLGTMAATLITVEAGAVLIPLQAQLSGVLAVPLSTFLLTMLAVHLLVGLLEGLLTISVLHSLQRLRPDLGVMALPGSQGLSPKATLATLALLALLLGGVFSLWASDLPDGLEWTYAQRPDQPGFESMTGRPHPSAQRVDELQARVAPLPDYTRRGSPLGQQNLEPTGTSGAWTSFAGVTGSLLTMGIIWLVSAIIRKKHGKAVQAC